MKSNVKFGSDIEWLPKEMAESPTPEFLGTYEYVLQRLGDKESPTQVKSIGQFHSDNIFTEGATPIAHGADDLLGKIYRLHDFLQEFTGLKLFGYDYVSVPTIQVGSFPYLYSELMHMGCSPDLRGGEIRVIPETVRAQPMREAGLHIHFDLPLSLLNGFRRMQSPNGVPVLVDPSGNVAAVMQELAVATEAFTAPSPPEPYTAWYRMPGTYRLKPYGVEYRSVGAGVFNDVDSMTSLLHTVERFANETWRTFS